MFQKVVFFESKNDANLTPIVDCHDKISDFFSGLHIDCFNISKVGIDDIDFSWIDDIYFFGSCEFVRDGFLKARQESRKSLDKFSVRGRIDVFDVK